MPGGLRGFCTGALLVTAVLFLLPGCREEAKVRYPLPTVALPDFDVVQDAAERKKKFFSFLRPLVEEENRRVMERRRRILRLHEEHRCKTAVSWTDIKWLEGILQEYGVSGPAAGDPSLWENLLRRVDLVPLNLALVQAAKESGWGTSRFAKKGNNLYGQRCFTEGCGIVPVQREAGATYEVRRFDSVAESVRSYIHNLNTHDAYRRFRRMRMFQRLEGKDPDGFSLAEGLPRYSERKFRYLDEIREMMWNNRRHLKS
jgi:Bax protein